MALAIAMLVGLVVLSVGVFGAWRILQDESDSVRRIVPQADLEPTPAPAKDKDDWVTYNVRDSA